MKAPQLTSDNSSRQLSPINRRSVWLFAITVTLLSESLLAQNPLRAQATDTHSNYATQEVLKDASASASQQNRSAVPAFDRATRSDNLGAIDRITQRANADSWTTNSRRESSVAPAGYNAPANIERRSAQRPMVNQSLLQPQPQTQPLAEPADQSKTAPNFIERENSSTSATETTSAPKKENLGQLISKLGMNLAFVLFLAIGGILVVKQWIKPQPTRRTTSKDADSDPLSMQIVETLRIDSKTTLHLVECGTSSVLVATDAAGLKSVNLLSSSFNQALLDDAVSQEEVQKSDNGATPRLASQIKQAYRKEASSTKSSSDSDSSSDGMDEKLIRMLLESSKKRKIAG